MFIALVLLLVLSPSLFLQASLLSLHILIGANRAQCVLFDSSDEDA